MNATALIADDEEGPRARLLEALRVVWPQLQVVAEAANGIDAWDCFLEREPQVCFLDVRMPGLTGVEVAQRIDGRAHVVFVSGHGDHALAAFDAGAVDYVLKPVDAERLAQPVQRVQARLAAQPASPPADLQRILDRLVGQVRRPAYLETIQAGAGREIELIRMNDVIFFESDARYTRVVHDDGDTLIRTPLKELLGRLDPAIFWQIHRGVIVAARHVAGTRTDLRGRLLVRLKGRKEELVVSRAYEELFKQM
ncbi:MAG TPA: LytTR family DNA-binding domain-containing protein [Albitalea sp.]|nr:LytTR family DNA-binding domain-containing protein [Albitalea sp.]